MNKFPVYRQHDESVDAQCFKCGDWWDKALAIPSGYPMGRGAFYSMCCKCNIRTYYDIEGAE